MESNNIKTKVYSVKASSHIITLLGDELIGSNSLALFELVKNSYDADADNVYIKFLDFQTDNPSISIEDDGIGMTKDIIEKAWLVIGTDYKRKEVKESREKRRTSLGNKGVGRLAVHRLANSIKLETQAIGENTGSMLDINWNDLINSSNYIDGLSVVVKHDVPCTFNSNHGTRIELSELREKHWTRAKVYEMVAKLQNIKNVFKPDDDFNIVITANNSKVQEWIDAVRTPVDYISNALYSFKFKLYIQEQSSNAGFDWSYSFNPTCLNNQAMHSVQNVLANDILPINVKDFDLLTSGDPNQKLLRNTDLEGIGTIEGEFYVFSMNSKIINLVFGTGSIGKVKDFLASNAGVKIFRDNMRVFNYGEPYDDWLGLDQRKMQRAGDHFAKGQTIGAINLNLTNTYNQLVEKTNREGFIENNTFSRLVTIVQTVFNFFEQYAKNDRDKIKAYIDSTLVQKKIGFSETIDMLEDKLRKKNLDKEFAGILKRVRHDYENMRDVMLNSGMSGLNLAIVFHEVEREMGLINNTINTPNCNIDVLKTRVHGLMELIEKFAPILKKNKVVQLKASTLVERAVGIHQTRFPYHKILLSTPVLTNEAPDFEIKGSGGLLMSAVSNVIDNAIYWVQRKRERIGGDYQCAIRVTTDTEHFKEPAIIVADNGEGFLMDPEDMVLPFHTLKPNGMGIGLYYVNLVMQMIGGKVIFTDAKELDLPRVYNGACVVLLFPKNGNQ